MLRMNAGRPWTGVMLLAVVGCGTEGDENSGEALPPRVEISSQSAALTAQENTENALRGVLGAAGFLAESSTLAEGLSSLGGESSPCSTSVSSVTCSADDPNCVSAPIVEETCESDTEEVTTADLEEAHQEMYEGLEELILFLKDELFIPANLESEDGTYAVYRIPTSMLCDDEGSVDSVPAGAGEPVSEEVFIEEETADDCEANAEKLQPRLRLSSPGEGDVDVEVLLTAEQNNPLTLQLYDDRIGMVVDLGELKASVEAAGEELEGVETLDGETSVQLVRNSGNNYSLRYSVLRDIVVVAGEGDERVEMMMAASSPAMELVLDGDDKAITGTLNYGALNLAAPLAALMDDEDYDDLGNPLPPKTYTGMLDLVLGGINGSLTYDGTTDILDFKNLGLGDVSTSVTHDGNTLLSLDVNPDHGRRFDLRVEVNAADDSGRLTFTPTFDLRAELGFQHISNQVSDIPQAFLSDSIRVWFEGDSPSIEASEAGLQVVSGSLHMSSESEPSASLSVDAGMCLVEAESEEEPLSVVSVFAADVCE